MRRRSFSPRWSGWARPSSCRSTASRGPWSSRLVCSSSRAVECSSTPRPTALSSGSPTSGHGGRTLVLIQHKLVGRPRSRASGRLVCVPRGHADPGRGRPRAAPRRDRRARGPERVRQDHSSPGSPSACSTPRPGASNYEGRAGYLSQDPGRYLVKETALEEVGLAVDGDEQRARAALEQFGLGWASNRHPRDLSSGERERLRWRRSRSPSRTCSSWTSPRGVSTRTGRRSWPPGCRSTRRPERPCCSRPTTATSRRTAESDLVLIQHKPRSGVALASRVAGLCAAAALALRRLGGARPVPRRDRDAAGRDRRPRGRFRLAGRRDGLGERSDAHRHARRPRRRRPRALRPGAERSARDRDRRRGGRCARSTPRLRRRRARRDRLQFLPRPGAAYALADARLGRLRPARAASCGRCCGTGSRSLRSHSLSASRSAR